jgi:hypothetical protein
MSEHPLDHRGLFDERDQAQTAAAPGTRQHIEPEGTGHPATPTTDRGPDAAPARQSQLPTPARWPNPSPPHRHHTWSRSRAGGGERPAAARRSRPPPRIGSTTIAATSSGETRWTSGDPTCGPGGPMAGAHRPGAQSRPAPRPGSRDASGAPRDMNGSAAVLTGAPPAPVGPAPSAANRRREHLTLRRR